MGPYSQSHIFLFILSICSSTSSSVDLTTFIYKGCANQKFQDPSGISTQNLKSLYQTLITQSSLTSFYNTTTGNTQLPTSITGCYQCRGDLTNSQCNTCVKNIPDMINKVCGGETIAARVQLDGCYLRYEVVGFPPAEPTDVLFKKCGSGRVSGPGLVESGLEGVVSGVGNGKRYYYGEVGGVYVMGQCEGSLGSEECGSCVRSAAEKVRDACGSASSGQVYLQQCYVWYSYNPNGVPGSGTGGGGGGGVIQAGATETGGGDGRRNTQKLVAIIIGGLAGLFLGIAFLLVLKSAFKKKKEKHSYYGGY